MYTNKQIQFTDTNGNALYPIKIYRNSLYLYGKKHKATTPKVVDLKENKNISVIVDDNVKIYLDVEVLKDIKSIFENFKNTPIQKNL